MAILQAPAGRRAIGPLNRLALVVAGLCGWRAAAMAAGAGVIAAATLPPLAAWPALFVAVAVLIWLLDGVNSRHRILPRRVTSAFGLGWCFGFGYFATSLYWVGFAFFVEPETFAVLMPFAVSALPAGLALFWGAAAAAAITLWQPSGIGRAAVLAVMLTGGEWLRGHLFTGFPWNAPGYAAGALDGLAQAAAAVGVNGMTLLVLLWAGLAAVAASEPLSRRAMVAATALLALAPAAWAIGHWRLATASTETFEGITLRIVQANIPQSEKWRAERREAIIAAYLDLSTAGGDHRITQVIWPESAVPVLLDERPEVRDRIVRGLPAGATLIAGALRRAPPAAGRLEVHNSVLAIDGGGAVAGTYDKWRLVPFGEYLPLAALLEPLGLRRLVPLPLGFVAGNGPATIAIAGTPPFAPLVCYEAIFSSRLVDPRNRPAWLVNVTNDGWFGNTAGPYQHLEQARFRAIEQGLGLARAANTGISAVIDPYGRIIERLGLGQAGSIDAPLPQPLPPTLYSRFGDGVFLVLLTLAAGLAVAARRL